MGIGGMTPDEWVVENENGIWEGLDEEEVDVKNEGWDDLEDKKCVVVVPKV